MGKVPFLFLRALVAVLTVVVLGCSERGGSARAGTANVDDFGVPVRTGTTTDPARIVSLNPTTTDLLFAMGAGPRLVGRTEWDKWSDSVLAVADLGPGLRPNVEAVLARRPDLVVLYASADNADAARQLRSAGVSVVALKVDRLADFRRATLILGAATGESDRAREVVDSVTATLERVREATSQLPHPSVFWHIWDAPIITIGRGSYMNDLVEIAGGRNVYDDVAVSSPTVSIEDVIHRDPDVIIAGPVGAAQMRASTMWRAVGAVRDGRIAVVDTMLVGRPGARLGEAAVSIARLLHPDAKGLP
jgi:ABC-type Fe3+-hydroxamate transport system substrate-binding protein